MEASDSPEIALSLDEARTQLTLRAGAATLALDAHELDSLIRRLGSLRARMTPPCEPALPENGGYLVVTDPAIEIREARDSEAVGLMFRSAEYGWIAYAVSFSDALAIGRHLVDELAHRVPATPA